MTGSKRPRRRTRFIVSVAGFLPALLFGLLVLWEPSPVRVWRDFVFDTYQRLAPRPYEPALPVRVVAIDDESLDKVGRWPWPRERLADLTRTLAESGAAAIAFDVIFSETETSAGDEALAAALGDAPVVLGFAGAEKGGGLAPKAGFATQGDDPRSFLPLLPGALLPLAPLREAAQGLGSVTFTPDRDLIVREIPTLFQLGGQIVPGFGVETLRVAQGARSFLVRGTNASGESRFGGHPGMTALRIGQIVAATDARGGVRVHYAGTQAQRRIPAWKILDKSFDRAEVEGAILLVGATATAIPDLKATPLEAAVPGIDIHAEFVESLMQGNLLTRPDWFRGLEAVLAVSFALMAAFGAARLKALPAALLTQALILAVLGASALAFLQADQLLDPVGPAAAAFLASAAAGVIVSRDTDREKQRIREAFQRYVSPAVVETLADNPERLTLGGESRILTLLFSDIRGFTSRSETLEAEAVVGFLNEIHAPLTEHVLDSGGTLDKFMGDGMMAFWNAPLDHPDHVRAALRTALRMQATVEGIDRRLEAEAEIAGTPHHPLAIGIGVHTGPASVGNIGSHRRFDYSAIGDTVNATARIEPLCKVYGVPILISADAAEAAPDFAHLLVDVVQLRGRSQETRLFALVGDETVVDDAFLDFKARHDRAVALAIAGHPGAVQACAELAGDPLGRRLHKLYALLIERAVPDRTSRAETPDRLSAAG